MKHIILAKGDNWEGLYVDGRLMSEGHSLATKDIVEEVLKWRDVQYDERNIDLYWLDEREEDLPPSISDVVWEGDGE